MKNSKAQGKGKKSGMRGSGDELNLEDLEASSFQGRRNKKSTNKKGKNNGYKGSLERADSEEENDGGQVSFQRRNNHGDYDFDRMG